MVHVKLFLVLQPRIYIPEQINNFRYTLTYVYLQPQTNQTCINYLHSRICMNLYKDYCHFFQRTRSVFRNCWIPNSFTAHEQENFPCQLHFHPFKQELQITHSTVLTSPPHLVKQITKRTVEWSSSGWSRQRA